MKPISVSIKEETFEEKLYFSVFPVWENVDRPSTFGWSVNKKLKDRLIAAILAGAAFKDPYVKKDVNGKTYIEYGLTIFGRTMNADLKRLGY